jgi:hypothetical protein
MFMELPVAGISTVVGIVNFHKNNLVVLTQSVLIVPVFLFVQKGKHLNLPTAVRQMLFQKISAASCSIHADTDPLNTHPSSEVINGCCLWICFMYDSTGSPTFGEHLVAVSENGECKLHYPH